MGVPSRWLVSCWLPFQVFSTALISDTGLFVKKYSYTDHPIPPAIVPSTLVYPKKSTTCIAIYIYVYYTCIYYTCIYCICHILCTQPRKDWPKSSGKIPRNQTTIKAGDRSAKRKEPTTGALCNTETPPKKMTLAYLRSRWVATQQIGNMDVCGPQ